MASPRMIIRASCLGTNASVKAIGGTELIRRRSNINMSDFFLYLGVQLLLALAIKGVLVISHWKVSKPIELFFIAGVPAIITAMVSARWLA
jgi:hypothetical protein